MKYIKFTVIPMLAILIFGCISDDYDDCERAFINFSYVGDGNTQIFDQKIEKVNLFVFNSEKRNILVKTINKSDLLKYHGIELNIPPGDYYVVCIGNAFENTKIDSELNGNMDSMRVSNPNIIDGKDVTTNDSLYYGIKKINIPSPENYHMVHDTVKFVSAHIKMHIEVAGLALSNIVNGTSSTTKSAAAIEYPILAVKNLIASIDLGNHLSKQLYSYYPTINYDSKEDIYYTDFSILRIQPESSVVLDLEDQNGKSIYSMKLSDFLKKYTQFDLTKNELVIAIRITVQPQGISVEIPEWIINEGAKPEL